MNARLIELQAMMLASSARIEGMKAHNAHAQMLGSSTLYDESAFVGEAINLDSIAAAARELAERGG